MVETKKSAKINKETDLETTKHTDLKAEAATAAAATATATTANNKRPLEKEQRVEAAKEEPQSKKMREDLIPAETEVIIHQAPDMTEEEKLALAEAARKEEELPRAEAGKKEEEIKSKEQEQKLPESASQEKKPELPSKEREKEQGKEQLSKTSEEKTTATSAK